MALTSSIVFKGSLGLEKQFSGLGNEIWASEESFDSRMVFIGPS